MPPVPHWWRGRMVLVGDAVHAPSNSTGQGASLAIESGVELARCLRDLPDPRTRSRRTRRCGAPASRRSPRGRPDQLHEDPRTGRAPGHARVMPPGHAADGPRTVMGPEQRYRIDWAAAVPAPEAVRASA